MGLEYHCDSFCINGYLCYLSFLLLQTQLQPVSLFLIFAQLFSSLV